MSISKHCSHVPPGGCWCALKPKDHLVKIKVLPPLLPCGSTFYAAVKASCTSKHIDRHLYKDIFYTHPPAFFGAISRYFMCRFDTNHLHDTKDVISC